MPGLYVQAVAHLDKVQVRDPEGMYISFPFAIPRGVWHLDKAGGPVRPGIDQLRGTCCDYYLVKNGAVLSGSEEGISWSSPDAPMVQIGQLRLWNFSTEIEPSGTLYSWLCNNKWETNFKAVCGGMYEFRYTIQASSDFKDPSLGMRRCQMNNYPFLAIRQ